MRLWLELFYDERIFTFSKLLLSGAGLWPENCNDFQFFFYILYVVLTFLLLVANFVQNMHDMQKAMKKITFVFPTFLVILKVLMFRLKIKQLSHLVTIINRNVSKGLYRNAEERSEMICYNVASTILTKFSAVSLFFVSLIYYVVPVFNCIMSSEWFFF